MSQELPESTEIISHIFGEDEHAEDEEAADNLVPETSQKGPFIICCQGTERDRRNGLKVVVHNSPTRQGGARARPPGKENRQECHQKWPNTHNGT